MKNSECTIYIMSNQKWVQKYRKRSNSWIQTSANGTERSLSAEQLLSHILPLLAGEGRFTVKVKPDMAIDSSN